MSEKILSITHVRQNLLKLAREAYRRMDRFVLTNKGQAEAVLLGIGDYRSLLAAAELASHPEVLEQIRQGFAEFERGESLTLEEALEQVRKERKPMRHEATATRGG